MNKNTIVKSVHVDDWTDELTFIVNNAAPQKRQSLLVFYYSTLDFVLTFRMCSGNRRRWPDLYTVPQVLPPRRSARSRNLYSVPRQHLRSRWIHLGR